MSLVHTSASSRLHCRTVSPAASHVATSRHIQKKNQLLTHFQLHYAVAKSECPFSTHCNGSRAVLSRLVSIISHTHANNRGLTVPTWTAQTIPRPTHDYCVPVVPLDNSWPKFRSVDTEPPNPQFKYALLGSSPADYRRPTSKRPQLIPWDLLSNSNLHYSSPA